MAWLILPSMPRTMPPLLLLLLLLLLALPLCSPPPPPLLLLLLLLLLPPPPPLLVLLLPPPLLLLLLLLPTILGSWAPSTAASSAGIAAGAVCVTLSLSSTCGLLPLSEFRIAEAVCELISVSCTETGWPERDLQMKALSELVASVRRSAAWSWVIWPERWRTSKSMMAPARKHREPIMKRTSASTRIGCREGRGSGQGGG